MPQDILKNSDVLEAVSRLKDAFVKANTPYVEMKKILADIAATVYPPMSSLPDKPPELWADETARRFATPRDFLEHVYAPWINKGLAWPYIHRHDKQLYNAVKYQLKKAGISYDDYLPSVSTLVTRELEAAGQDGVKAANRIIANAFYRRKAL